MKKLNMAMLAWVCSMLLMSADTYQLQPPKRGDFAPDKLINYQVESRSLNESRDELSFHWLLNSNEKINLSIPPQTVMSRSYSIEMDARSISAGITIETTAPGAIVRLFAIHGPDEELDLDSGYALLPENMILVNRKEEAFQGEEAFKSFVSVEEMDEAGFSLPEGTIGFQINPRLGSGTFTLHIDQYTSDFPLRMHVFEKDSSYVLNVQMNSDIAFNGSQVTVYGDLLTKSNRESNLNVERLEAQLISPSGEIYPMRVLRTEKRLAATANLPERSSSNDGLWEVKVQTVLSNKEIRVIRDARTAFSSVQPTARFTGRVEVSGLKNEMKKQDDAKGDLSLAFEVEPAASGRYEVKGLIYGSNREGQLLPLAMINAATYLEETGMIEATVSQETIRKSELGAPFKVMGLTLKDQSRFTVLTSLREALNL